MTNIIYERLWISLVLLLISLLGSIRENYTGPVFTFSNLQNIISRSNTTINAPFPKMDIYDGEFRHTTLNLKGSSTFVIIMACNCHIKTVHDVALAKKRSDNNSIIIVTGSEQILNNKKTEVLRSVSKVYYIRIEDLLASIGNNDINNLPIGYYVYKGVLISKVKL